MEKHYEGLADEVVNGIKAGHAAMADIRARANARIKEVVGRLAKTRGMLEQFAKDDAERATEFKKKARIARTERATANTERIAGTRQMLRGHHKDSTERAKSFKRLLAAARAARKGRWDNGKGAAAEPKTETTSRNGRRRKARP